MFSSWIIFGSLAVVATMFLAFRSEGRATSNNLGRAFDRAKHVRQSGAMCRDKLY